MKNNKAFTLVELLIVIVIIGIVLTTVGAFGNIFKLLFWALVYFAIPASIFGVALKLNQKYKWVVKGKYNGRYIANFIDGEYIDNDMVAINLWAFFIIWPLYLTGVLAIIGGKEVYHRYLKHWFNIPEGK
jgi:prepilin-type N-terminal cleavage/methylation domain-containing protein